MKQIQIGLSAFLVILLEWTLFLVYHDTNDTSTPVERSYHDDIVVIVDSILDARFGPGCCEEVIDSDDVSVPHTRFGELILE